MTGHDPEGEGGAPVPDDLAQTDRLTAVATAAGATDWGGPGFRRGDKLHRFIVLELLGQGGMGSVVSAYDPDLDRKVAIKVLRADIIDEGSAGRGQQRLLREAQAMAKLSHPNVVTVHEVGTVGDRVFVAMEFIDGQTLRSWLKEKPRAWREVVEVFVQAGRGLAAAHAAALVHRDFKPDNAMVRKDGRVCVMDFGLASASAMVAPEDGSSEGAGAGLAARTPLSVTLTQAGALLGTPTYMAPEQHERKHVDARADQFSFCVALYEGLWGERPFEGTDYTQLLCNVTQGKMRPPPAESPVPGWVRDAVLRGLSVDPERRFPSMEALLQALATDPGAAQRRRLRVGAKVAVAVLSTVAALGLSRSAETHLCEGMQGELAGVWDDSTKGAVQKAFVETRRPYALDTYARVARLLDAYAAGWIAMRTEACEATHKRHEQSEHLFDLRIQCLNRRRSQMAALTALFAKGPDLEALEKAVDAAAGLTPVAGCADVAALAAAVPLPEDPVVRAKVEALRRRLDEAETLEKAGKYQAGLSIAKAVAEETQPISYPPIQAESLYLLGCLQEDAGDAKAAEATLGPAVQRAALAKDDGLLARIWIELVWILGAQGRAGEVLALGRVAEAAAARAGDQGSLRAQLFRGLGRAYGMQGKPAEARSYYERALSFWEGAHGPEHPIVGRALSNLGSALVDEGKLSLARSHFERALAITEKAVGPQHPFMATILNNLGMVAGRLGKPALAQSYYERALALWESALGPEHPRVATALNNLGTELTEKGRLSAARSFFERARAIWEKTGGPQHPHVAGVLNNLGMVANRQGKPAEAQRYYERALGISERAFGPKHPDVAMALSNLGEVLNGQGKYAEARSSYERALAIWEAALGRDHPDVAEALTGLGKTLLGLRRPSEAASSLERALRIREANPGDPAELADTCFTLARALWEAARDRARAVALATRARDAYAKAGGLRMGELAAVEAWLAGRGAR
jgi:serine/threonine-protein kinase